MAANSTLFSRLTLSHNDAGSLPSLHTGSRRSVKHKPSEYDLDELSPIPDESFPLSSDPEPAFFSDSKPRSKPPSAFRKRRVSPSPSPSRNDDERFMPKPSPSTRMKSRVLFAGPPPPIATSMLMYKDVEDRGGSVLKLPYNQQASDQLGASVRYPTSSVLFDQSTARHAARATAYDTDSTWTNLQRQERALQKEIQKFLDIQSAGLSAGLGRGSLNPSPSLGLASDSNPSWNQSPSQSNTPPTESAYTTSARSSRLPTDRETASGAVIPVRQPRPRKLGLRAARSGLARGIAQLAALKAEEEASLAAALSERTRALAQLRKLAGRRASITDELQSLEADDEEPLTHELRTLESAHASTGEQIAELEKQLAMLRSRQRTLAARLADVQNQREAGLSGYKGALKEVDAQLAAVLRRPPVQPLGAEVLGGGGRPPGQPREDSADDEGDETEEAVGVEFLRLRPERRTAEMARAWWENEVKILQRRKREVDMEQAALEDGGAVWSDAVHLISEFEAELRRQIASNGDNDDTDYDDTAKGKQKIPTPEERMYAQLGRMGDVIAGLETHLQTAEDKGWNLLLCAIGAELEAFREARRLLQEALQAAGFDVGELGPRQRGSGDNDEDNDATPRLVGSLVAMAASKHGTDTLVNTTTASHDDHGASESEDNEVPPDLFATHDDDPQFSTAVSSADDSHLHDQDDSSENEVPLEFLSEHRG